MKKLFCLIWMAHCYVTKSKKESLPGRSIIFVEICQLITSDVNILNDRFFLDSVMRHRSFVETYELFKFPCDMSAC